MKIFRRPIIECLSGIESKAPADTTVYISAEARSDLLIWAGFLKSDFKWLPICRAYAEPPMLCKEFASDAAGLSDQADFASLPGCGNVGFDEEGKIIFANQFTWPNFFITQARDDSGVRYGDKTTTLEMIGLLMPMLLVPDLLAGHHIRFTVDCFGTVFGMHNRASAGDTSASVFIRAAYLIGAYIGCSIHVQHLPRLSDWGAETTDRLSRRLTTTTQDYKLLGSFRNRSVPRCLYAWFEDPKPDYRLALALLDHVKTIMYL